MLPELLPFAQAEVHSPNWERLLDRRLVHRVAHSEVFVTSLDRQSPTEWVGGVQIPTGHTHLTDAGGEDRRLSLVLGIELLRQLGIAVSHLDGAVPLDWQFILDHGWFTGSVDGLPRMPARHPLQMTAMIEIVARTERRGMTSGLTLSIRFTDSHGDVAVGGGRFRCLSPDTFRAVRRNSPKVMSSSVSCSEPLLAPGDQPGEYRVGADTKNPFHFDHTLDHIPGTLLIEAAAHAHEAATGRTGSSIHIAFAQFAEFTDTVRLTIQPMPDGDSVVEITQSGALCAVATIS